MSERMIETGDHWRFERAYFHFNSFSDGLNGKESNTEKKLTGNLKRKLLEGVLFAECLSCADLQTPAPSELCWVLALRHGVMNQTHPFIGGNLDGWFGP